MKHFLLALCLVAEAFAQTPAPPPLSVLLQWTAIATCVDGSPCAPASYRVYKISNEVCPSGSPVGPGSGATTPGVLIATLPPSQLTYTDTQIIAQPPTAYCYYVTGVNVDGNEGLVSQGATITANPALLGTPTNFILKIVPMPAGQWQATWNYDCGSYAAPKSFEIGIYNRTTLAYLRIGNIPVTPTASSSGCVGNQAFHAQGSSTLITPTSTFYVRGVNAKGAFGTAAFYCGAAACS